MITSELNKLIKEYDAKKDILDNHTSNIVKDIRDWCLAENDRIDNEYTSLCAFFTSNLRKFGGLFYVKGSAYLWNGLKLAYATNDKGFIDKITSVSLDMDYQYKMGFGFTWTKLPRVEREYLFYRDRLNVNSTDIDYWMQYKRFLAIRNETLAEVAKLSKSLIVTMIHNEKSRCEEMVKAVNDITNDTKTEITISIR